jgi:hypothetical protein
VILAAIFIATVLALGFGVVIGAAIERSTREPALTEHQARQAIHPPEVRGQLIDMEAWRKSAPRFTSKLGRT